MALHRVRSSLGVLVSSTALVVACSAPPGSTSDDEGAVPDYVGPVPGNTGAGAGQTGASTPPPASNGAGAQNPEVIGNSPGGVPIDGNAGSNTNNSGASAGSGTPGSPSPGSGAGGSASTAPPATPEEGAGGSAMPGAAGSGDMGAPVDPGSETAPPPANEPPPANPPPANEPPPANPPPANPPPANEPPPANPPPANPPPANEPPPANPPPANPPAAGTGSGCAPGAAFFCEDFEASAVGTAQANDSWRPEGNVSIDDQQGSRALHVQAQAGQNARILVQNFAPPNNSFFGRVNMFVEQFPTAPDNAHFVLVEVTGNSGERVRPIGGQFKQGVADVSIWGVGADGGATGDWTDWQPTAPTVSGQWVCMEWQMNAADNSVDVFIDGVQKPELHASTNQHGGNQTAFNFPAFNNIALGWVVFQGGAQPSQYDVWLDDIVLSTERVGCD